MPQVIAHVKEIVAGNNGSTLTASLTLDVIILNGTWADAAEDNPNYQSFIFETDATITLSTTELKMAKDIATAACNAVNSAVTGYKGINVAPCTVSDVLVPGWGDQKFPPTPDQVSTLYRGDPFLVNSIPGSVGSFIPISRTQETLRIGSQNYSTATAVIKFNTNPTHNFSKVCYALYGINIEASENTGLRSGTRLTDFSALNGNRITASVPLDSGSLANKNRYLFFVAVRRVANSPARNPVKPSEMGEIEQVTMRLS